MSTQDAAAIMRVYGAASDGLTLGEFSQLGSLVRAFHEHDADKDGRLDADQSRFALSTLGLNLGSASEGSQHPDATPSSDAITLLEFAVLVRKLAGAQLTTGATSTVEMKPAPIVNAKSMLTGSFDGND